MVKLLPQYLLIICSAVTFDSASQNTLEFTQLNVKDGLSNSTVTCFYQDSRNFLWIGTGNGLCKYNGTSLKIFRNDPFNTSSLSGNHINDIIGTEVQGEEILWIATEFGGVTAFNLETNSIIQFKNQEGQPTILLDNRCSDLLLLSNGLIAVVNMKGIDFIDPATLKVYKDPYKTPIWATDIRESNGMLYIASRNGILTAEIPYLKNGDYIFPFSSRQQLLSDHSISFIFPTDSMLLLGTTDGFFKYDQVYDNLTRIPLPAGNITSTAYHFGPSALDRSKNQIWLTAAEHGVFRYDIQENETHWFAGSNSIYPDKVNCTYIDHFGSLWLGTYRCGALKTSLASATFRKITISDPSVPFEVNDIYSIYMLPNNHLLVGNSTGGIYVAKEGEELSPLRFNTGNPFISQGSIIGSYHYDSDNENLWVGNMSRSLMIAPLKAKDISTKNISGPPIVFRGDSVFDVPNISGWSVRDIEKDDSGFIWIGTFDGGLTKLAAQSLNKESVINPSLLHGIREIFNPGMGWNDFLLISCTKGLVFLNTKTNELTHVNELFPKKEKQPPLENTIWGIYQESPSRFWLCTTTNGIALLEIEDVSKEKRDVNHIKIRYFNEKHGIPSGELFGIMPDNDNNLWISGERSLIRFSIADHKVRVFTQQDKIGQEAFNFGAYNKGDSSGIFYFGGNDGITSFKPSEIVSAKKPILPLISGMYVNGKELEAGDTLSSGFVMKKNITYSDFVRLAYNENLVTFNLNIFNADISLANHLFYKLEGVDNEWQKVNGPEYFVTYSNLKPGTYKMRLKAENLTEGAEDSFTIQVAPPWYSSGLANFIYGILMLSGLAFFRWVVLLRERYRNQLEIERIKFKKSEELARRTHELDKMKIRFFMNISHEFRTPLTLIMGPLNKLQNGIGMEKDAQIYLDLINRNAQRLLRLINQLLDFRRLETGHVKPGLQPGDIVTFVDEIVQNYQIKASSKEISLHFRSAVERLPVLFDPDIVEKVTDNLINNALKYTPPKCSVAVELVYRPNTEKSKKCLLQIIVSDTGIGIPEEERERIFDRFYRVENNQQRHAGFGVGLSYARELAGILNGTLIVEPNKPKGSKFVFSFPANAPANADQVQESPHLKDQPGSDRALEVIKEAPETNPYIPDIATTNGQSTNKPHILIVEDNTDIVLFLVNSLKDEFSVGVANDGIEALGLISTNPPDMILSDVMMPGMDGITLSKKLKSNIETSHIPIILITARTAEDYHMEGLLSGAEDYITKPFNEEILKIRIRNIFKTRNALAERLSSGISESLPFSGIDLDFIKEVNETIERNLANSEFNTEQLAHFLGLSRTMLFKKMKSLLGTTAGEYILSFKMKAAKAYLSKTDKYISEICYSVGFSEPKHFTRTFKKHTGLTPSEYRQKNCPTVKTY